MKGYAISNYPIIQKLFLFFKKTKTSTRQKKKENIGGKEGEGKKEKQLNILYS